MVSAASGTWSSTIQQTKEQTEKPIEDHAGKHTTEQTKTPTQERIPSPTKNTETPDVSPLYRAPYVDNCEDESEDTHGGLLSPDFPYVLDDASIPSSPILKSLSTLASPTSPLEPIGTSSTRLLEEKVPSLSPNDLMNEASSTYRNLTSPYSILKSEKIDIFKGTRPSRSNSIREDGTLPISDDAENPKSESQHHENDSGGKVSKPPFTTETPVTQVEDLVDNTADEGSGGPQLMDSRSREYGTLSDGSSNDNDEEQSQPPESVLLYGEVESYRDALASSPRCINWERYSLWEK